MEYKLQYQLAGDEYLDVEGRRFFRQSHRDTISKKITELLAGVHPEGKDIVVSPEVILHVMERIYDNHWEGVTPMTDNVIGIITSTIRNEFAVLEQHKRLNIWDAQLLGDHNPHGLRRHSDLNGAIASKHPIHSMYWMNY